MLEAGEQIALRYTSLAMVTARLALEELRSAPARCEQFVGEWLPEPLVTRSSADPAARTELADALSFAFLIMLESRRPSSAPRSC